MLMNKPFPVTRCGDLHCIALSNGVLELLVAQDIGPRILSLRLVGRENLLAELPEFVIERPGGESFHFWGGHRLWYAPESQAITYLPDNRPVEMVPLATGVQVNQPPEEGTGMQKSLLITLAEGKAEVVVEHTLTNGGARPRTCAPWAITQFKPGGFAILPQNDAPNDPDGLLPNRALALWPYTKMDSPFIHWGNRFIFVEATMTKADGPLKIGWPNPAGWLAYLLGDILFVKQAAYQPDATYLDMGSSSECYARYDFLELETLGPRVVLEPGQSVSHQEVWQLFPNVSLPMDEDAVAAMVSELVY